jgi:hypothetical protein
MNNMKKIIKFFNDFGIFGIDEENLSDIKKGLNGLAFNSISSLAMSNQMIIKIIKYL